MKNKSLQIDQCLTVTKDMFFLYIVQSYYILKLVAFAPEAVYHWIEVPDSNWLTYLSEYCTIIVYSEYPKS